MLFCFEMPHVHATRIFRNFPTRKALLDETRMHQARGRKNALGFEQLGNGKKSQEFFLKSQPTTKIFNERLMT